MIDIDSLLPRDSHVVVYRTVQEALTNIGKHAQAGNVSIGIRKEEDSVLFSIEDDGIGFDERASGDEKPRSKRVGFVNDEGACTDGRRRP